MENSAVTNFREYIQIKTVHPNPDYDKAIAWLRKQAEELDAEFHVTECIPGKPIAIISVEGKEPSLPSILLNSHMDVVPVFPEHWKYDPFSAFKDEEGNIYGRGTQDMKCVAVQYMEAMKFFHKENVQLLRTVHMLFVPEEEIGGADGMGRFVKTEEFKRLNVGFGLDEGYASTDDEFFVFYSERNIWQFYVRCPGSPGHGSLLLSNTAGEKVRRVINEFLSFRETQEKKLKEDSSLSLGDVVTVNLTLLEGGVQYNVIPAEMSAGFDVRIPPTVDLTKFEEIILGWCKSAGDDVSIDFYQKCLSQCTTCVENGKNVWWDNFKAACQEENVKLRKQIFPGGTDSRYIRELGIPALGFSPMNNTPLLLHNHNEFLNEKIFLRGIDIYKTIIRHLANLRL